MISSCLDLAWDKGRRELYCFGICSGGEAAVSVYHSALVEHGNSYTSIGTHQCPTQMFLVSTALTSTIRGRIISPVVLSASSSAPHHHRRHRDGSRSCIICQSYIRRLTLTSSSLHQRYIHTRMEGYNGDDIPKKKPLPFLPGISGHRERRTSEHRTQACPSGARANLLCRADLPVFLTI
jgi:hypothetical protein